jgi:hypothetical protein
MAGEQTSAGSANTGGCAGNNYGFIFKGLYHFYYYS